MKKLTECDGMKYTAKIMSKYCEGKITVEKERVYLCQNGKEGNGCADRRGYKYSWLVDDGSEVQMNANDVTDFILLSANPETYKDWQVGDKIRERGLEREVIFRSGELVVCRERDGVATNNYTCDEMFSKGWRLIADPAEPEMVEVTLEEVARGLGIDVKTLRIKDK